MRAFLALWLAIAALGASPQAIAHAPSKQECVEGGDFIAHAADARDNGMSKSAFLDRLKADITLIQAFPPDLRWFAADSEDAEFLLSESSDVFDSPQDSESHRAQFLEHCFERAKPRDSGSRPGVERLARSIMSAAPISRYPVPKLEDVPEDIRARMLEVQEKAGFIPNVFLTLAHRPDEFRAFLI